MALGRAMTHFAGHRLVVVGRPLRMTFTMTALAITRRLVRRFLSGDFRDRVGAVMTVSVERVSGEVPFCNRSRGEKKDKQNNQPDDMLGHARAMSYSRLSVSTAVRSK